MLNLEIDPWEPMKEENYIFEGLRFYHYISTPQVYLII
jgi:hypothetical protein